MKLAQRFIPGLVLLVISFSVACQSAPAADTPECDCTIFPFLPNPPCFDRCTVKHLAIAPVSDLEKVFGLPADVAKKIGDISPNQRPRSLKVYKAFLSDSDYEALLKKTHSLNADDFAKVRAHADLAGYSIKGLQW
jgi:hypothetical protein